MKLAIRSQAGRPESFGAADPSASISISYPRRSARAKGGAGAAPVLLLHGFATAGRVLAPLARYLRRELRRPVMRLALGGATPLHLGDVRCSARRVHDAIQEVVSGRDVPHVDVVGHSLGGLVATYLLKAIDRGKRVRRVVTLGAPHRGTPLALLGALPLGIFSRAVWQMLPGSPLLKEIERLPVPEGSDLFALEADGDALVPLRFGRPPAAPGQVNAVLPGIGHIELLYSPRALHAVRALLA